MQNRDACDFDNLNIPNEQLQIVLKCKQNMVLQPERHLLRPLTWKEVTILIKTNNLHYLGRTLQQQHYYDNARLEMLKLYNSLTDCVLITRLGCLPENDSKTGKLKCAEAVPSKNEEEKEQSTNTLKSKVSWCLNDFPYGLEEGIYHHLLWSTEVLNEEIALKHINDYLSPNEYEILTFVNPPSLQSVRAVYHCHVFSRRRKEGE